MITSIDAIQEFIERALEGTDYVLTTLRVDEDNNLLVEISREGGVWIDDCAKLNRRLVDWLEAKGEPDYSIEVGSSSHES